jgi:hypothetical protein
MSRYFTKPDRVTEGGRVRTRHQNNNARAIEELQKAQGALPPSRRTTSTSIKHPFKISVKRESSQNRMYVEFGWAFVSIFEDDSANQQIPVEARRIPLFTSGDRLSNDIYSSGAGTTGHEVLSTSTTYGVWMRFKGIPTDATDEVPFDVTDFQFQQAIAYSADTPEIVVSSTYTNYTDQLAFISNTTGYCYHYIGKVAIDGSDVATITQFQKESIHLPAAYLPTAILSGAGTNLLSTGTDNGVRLNPEDVVTDITGGTDIDATDDGGGTWTIDYTGS